MNRVEETIDLISQLDSIVDDSREGLAYGGILSIMINGDGGNQVHMDTPEFLNSVPVKEYDAELRTFDEFPYYLSIEVEGIKFYTIFCHAELAVLEKSHPEHYEYILQAVMV